jgi:hypothetical protein
MIRVAIIAALCAGCIADLELGDPAVERVCINGAPLSFTGGDATAEIDLAPLDLEVEDDQVITFASARVSPLSGITNLRFADSVTLRLVDVTIVDATVTGDLEVELPGNPTLDLAGHLRQGADRLAIAVGGDLPPDRWSVAIDLCFDVDSGR